jgi:hypothetical protein
MTSSSFQLPPILYRTSSLEPPSHLTPRAPADRTDPAAPVELTPAEMVAMISSSLKGPAPGLVSTQAAFTLSPRDPNSADADTDDHDNLPVLVTRAFRDDPDETWSMSPIISGGLWGLGIGALLAVCVLLAIGGFERVLWHPKPLTASSPRPIVATTLVGDATDARPRVTQSKPSPLAFDDLLIADGNLTGARELLALAARDGQSDALLALAETYDPHVLAAWGVREAAADVARARQLYGLALEGGQERARRRLDALD